MNIFITLLAAVQIASASHGIDPSSIDKVANPTSDFYQYANGGWLKKTQIPSDRPGIDAFYEVNDRVEQQVRSVVDATVSNSEWEPGS
jgi:putative endopeptidase